MSDTRIDSSQALTWAQEVTLKRLTQEVEVQTDLLAKIAGVRGESARAARAASESLEDLEDSASGASDALDDAARAARRAEVEAKRREASAREEERKRREDQYERERREYQYRQSLNDLRQNLNAVSSATPASLWSSLGDKLAVMGGTMTAAGGAASVLGGSLTMLSRVVAVAAAAFTYYRDGFQTLTSMTEAGVLFNGSVEQMRQSVGRTGLSLQDFSRIVNQYGQVIGGVGEQSYARNLRQVQDLTRQFGRYGQSLEQQAESVSSFFDMLRSGGQIFMMTEQQRSQAAAEYIAQTTALTRLTGRQRRQIEQEQQQVMMQAEVDLAIREMRARGDTAGAEAMQQMVSMLTATMGAEVGTGLAAMQMGIVPRNQDLRRLLYTTGMGESVQGMVGQMRTMTPEQMTAQSEAIFRRIGQDPQLLGMLRVGATAGGSMEGAARLMTRMFQERGDRLVQAGRQGEMDPMLQVMAGRRGILDQAATGFAQVTGDVQRSLGDLRAAIARVTEQFGVFSTAFPALSAGTQMLTGVTGGIFDYAAEAALGALGLYGGYRLLRGRGGGPTLGTAPGVPPMGGGGTPGIRGATPLPGMTMGRAIGGAGIGLAGAGLGALASGAGYTGLGNALSGAGMGAGLGMMLGPWGALLGGALGGAAGYLGLLGGGATTPAGAPTTPITPPDMAQGFRTLNTTLTQELGPSGTLASLLERLISAVQDTGSRTVTAIREIS